MRGAFIFECFRLADAVDHTVILLISVALLHVKRFCVLLQSVRSLPPPRTKSVSLDKCPFQEHVKQLSFASKSGKQKMSDDNYGSIPGQEKPIPAQTAGMPNDPFGEKFRVEQLVMKRDICEALTGCECGNRYSVVPESPNMTRMYVTEDSTCLCKVCCGAMRELKFDVFYGGRYEDRKMRGDNDPQIIQFDKPFVCQCCSCPCICTDFCRPKAIVKWTGDAFGGKRNIGHVQDHCQLCGVREEIYNANAEHIYTVKGGCCQCGALCPCGDALYEVVDRKFPGERVVGKVEKKGSFSLLFLWIWKYIRDR